jgi:hypothetical protein
MVDAVTVEVAISLPRVIEETVMEDPTNVENNPLLRLSVEIPIVDVI